MNNRTEIFEQEEVFIEYYSDDEVVIEEIIYEATEDDSSEASSYYEEEIVGDELTAVLEEEEEESEDDESDEEEEAWESEDDETPFWAKLQLKTTEKGNELRKSGNLAAPITFTPFKNTDFTNKLCSPKSLKTTEQGQTLLKKQEGSSSPITTHHNTRSLKKKRAEFTNNKLRCNPDFLKRISALLQQQPSKMARFAECA
jgi:hypothetical protein